MPRLSNGRLLRVRKLHRMISIGRRDIRRYSCLCFVTCYTGRWPVKSAKFLRGLLKNAEANAIANELTPEDLMIRNIVVQQAPVR